MTHQFTRREWLAAGGAALAVGGSVASTACGKGQPIQPAMVSIVRAAAYDQSLYDTIRRIIVDHRVDVRGRNVVLKPNLVEFEPTSTINTHPIVVHAALEAFRAAGAATVRVAEGPGHRRNTLDLADAAGYFKTIPQFEDLFTDLNLDEVTRVEFSRKYSRLKRAYLPNTALGADLLVSIAKMKTHHWVGATLSMKNLFGLVPSGVYGWPKNVLHWAGITESIADLHTVFPRQFAIVDGIIGMEGNGPIQGVAKPAGVLIAGADPLAVDATCCRIMCMDPHRIGYLTLAADGREARLDEQYIRHLGEAVRSVAIPFQTPPHAESLRLQKS